VTTKKPYTGPRCSLTGDPMALVNLDAPPLLVHIGDVAICHVAEASLAEVKTLKIVLTRDARTGRFILDQVACVEAIRAPYQSYDDAD